MKIRLVSCSCLSRLVPYHSSPSSDFPLIPFVFKQLLRTLLLRFQLDLSFPLRLLPNRSRRAVPWWVVLRILIVSILFLANRFAYIYTNVSAVCDAATCSRYHVDQSGSEMKKKKKTRSGVFYYQDWYFYLWKCLEKFFVVMPTSIDCKRHKLFVLFLSSFFSVYGQRTQRGWSFSVPMSCCCCSVVQRKINEVKFKIYNIFIIIFSSFRSFLGNFIWYELWTEKLWVWKISWLYFNFYSASFDWNVEIFGAFWRSSLIIINIFNNSLEGFLIWLI